MKFRLGAVLAILVLYSHFNAQAQNDNYWSWNFNTTSTLLAGAVTGGGAGPSAIYYNPALIDQENISNFSLSANLISLQFFKAKNIAGEGYSADQFIFKIQPRFISYTLDHKNEKLGIELSVLTPVSKQIRFSGQYFNTLDVIKRTEGVESYSAYLNYTRKYDDIWFGGGLSYRFSEQWYVGMSGFVSTKTMKYQYSESPKAYQETDSVLVNGTYEQKYIAATWFQEEFKYWYTSMLFKLGVQYRAPNKRFSAGVNLSLPDIPIIGRGDVRKEIGRSEIYNNQEDHFISNENVTGIEEDIKVRVKSPFSAALGIQYITANGKSTFSWTLEYFSKIAAYSILESDFQAAWLPAYLSEELSDNDFLSYAYEATSVTNLAMGFKQIISPSFYLLAGFRTDFTASIPGNEAIISEQLTARQVYLDKYHLTLGPVWKFQRYKIVSGMQYTFGRNNNSYQMVNFADPVEYDPSSDQSLVGTGKTNAEAALDEIALFFGISIDLIP